MALLSRGAAWLVLALLISCTCRKPEEEHADAAVSDSAPANTPVDAPASRPTARRLTVLEIIERALADNGIPRRQLPVFLAFAHLESTFDPLVVSPVGAAGLFQLMPGTALTIAEAHPDFTPGALTIFNPRWRSGRRLLHAGPTTSYPRRVLRIYSAHLHKLVRRLRKESADRDALARGLAAADGRFDPLTSARLATFHIDRLRRQFFGRRRCFRSGERRVCGRFGGRHATMLAAAAFHLGTPTVTRAIAETGARSFKAYIRGVSRSTKRSHRDNGRYLRRLWRLSRTYRRLVEQGRPDRAAVEGAFRDPGIAENLFTTYRVRAGATER